CSARPAHAQHLERSDAHGDIDRRPSDVTSRQGLILSKLDLQTFYPAGKKAGDALQYPLCLDPADFALRRQDELAEEVVAFGLEELNSIGSSFVGRQRHIARSFAGLVALLLPQSTHGVER